MSLVPSYTTYTYTPLETASIAVTGAVAAISIAFGLYDVLSLADPKIKEEVLAIRKTRAAANMTSGMSSLFAILTKVDLSSGVHYALYLFSLWTHITGIGIYAWLFYQFLNAMAIPLNLNAHWRIGFRNLMICSWEHPPTFAVFFKTSLGHGLDGGIELGSCTMC